MDGPSIIIIGAGIAGLTAARKLFSTGYDTTVILEAQDRIGGRIWTENFGNNHIEHGAQWIHGEAGNPLFDIANSMDVLVEDGDQSKVEESQFFANNGEHISSKLVNELTDVMDALSDKANGFHRQNYPFPIGVDSVGDFFNDGFDSYLKTSTVSTHDKKNLKGLYKWRRLLENTDNACDSIDELSLEAWGQYLEYDGCRYVLLKHGYKPIIDDFIQGIPVSAIKLSTKVDKIEWKETSGERTKVTCDNGEIYTADYVICTMSVGVLKSRADSLFVPNLPKAKLQSLERIGFGVVDKIFLEFDQPFWEKESDGIQFVWLEGDVVNLDSVDNSDEMESKQWYKGIIGFDTVYGNKNMLIGWIAGHEARIMESRSDEEVKNVSVELLRLFTNYDIPDPVSFKRTRWFNNVNVQGSYSYCRKQGSLRDFEDLARPLPNMQNPVLLFAGEATHPNYFSTVHGAHLTGLREAQRIINHSPVAKTKGHHG